MLNLMNIVFLVWLPLLVAVSKTQRDAVIKTPLLYLVIYLSTNAFVFYYPITLTEYSMYALAYIGVLFVLAAVVLPLLKKCC